MTAHSPFFAACTSTNFENPGTAADGFVQSEKTQLGWVLTRNKFITPPQLETALTTQQIHAKKLGELLMEQRLISEAQLRDALREQIIRRRGHWVI